MVKLILKLSVVVLTIVVIAQLTYNNINYRSKLEKCNERIVEICKLANKLINATNKCTNILEDITNTNLTKLESINCSLGVVH